MLGSVHDAEDALQDALLRAWRGLARFEGRSSLRSWLYTIATNTCLNADRAAAQARAADRLRPGRRPARRAGRAGRRVGVDRALPGRARSASRTASPAPEARYEQRESVELAFIAALQHLPANQRAVLILREVLGFSAKEAAETLDTTVGVGQQRAAARARDASRSACPSAASRRRCARSATSALQRARRALRRRVGARRRRRGRRDARRGRELRDAAAGAPGSAAATRSRPSCAGWPLSGAVALARRASRAPTASRRSPSTPGTRTSRRYLPFALNVLTFRGEQISDVTAFIVRTPPEDADREIIARLPEQPTDPAGCWRRSSASACPSA